LFTLFVVTVWENDRQRDSSDGHWAAYFWPSSRLTPWLDKCQDLRRRPCGGVDDKNNEWDLLKLQFDALTHDESVESRSIEEIL
jgi:hypothetical protein